MKYLVVVLAVLLAGCAAQVRSSGERSVVIWAPGNAVAEAQGLAERECGKHGRTARLAGQLNNGNLVYDCLP